MRPLPVTDKQKEMLRSLAVGLKLGTIKTEWTIFYGGDRISGIFGLDDEGLLWREVWQHVNEADFTKFVKLGFFTVIGADKYGLPSRYTLDDYAIIKAVENNFEAPASSNPMAHTTYHIGNISNANVNIESTLQDVVQEIQAAPNLEDDFKREFLTQIDALKTALGSLSSQHQSDIQKVSKQIARLVEDLSEAEPDKEAALITLEGLQKAARNIILVLPAVADITQKLFEIVSRLN